MATYAESCLMCNEPSTKRAGITLVNAEIVYVKLCAHCFDHCTYGQWREKYLALASKDKAPRLDAI